MKEITVLVVRDTQGIANTRPSFVVHPGIHQLSLYCEVGENPSIVTNARHIICTIYSLGAVNNGDVGLISCPIYRNGVGR